MEETKNPVRKPVRLKEYGYGTGVYFVTICTQNRERGLCAITVGACPAPTGKGRLSSVIGSMKSHVSHIAGHPIWQRSFYDHVIRSQQDFEEIWRHIDNNPLQWLLDKE